MLLKKVFFYLLVASSLFWNVACSSGAKYTGESKYVGKFKNGLKDGKGTTYHTNGDIYTGEYKNGRRYGQGTLYYTDGKKFVGRFKNSYKESGTYYYINGFKETLNEINKQKEKEKEARKARQKRREKARDNARRTARENRQFNMISKTLRSGIKKMYDDRDRAERRAKARELEESIAKYKAQQEFEEMTRKSKAKKQSSSRKRNNIDFHYDVLKEHKYIPTPAEKLKLQQDIEKSRILNEQRRKKREEEREEFKREQRERHERNNPPALTSHVDGAPPPLRTYSEGDSIPN